MRDRRGLYAVPNPVRSFHVLLDVPDIAVASAFYTRLFGSDAREIVIGRRYFHSGSLLLGLVDLSRTECDPIVRPRKLDLTVRELEPFHERAAAMGALRDGTIQNAPAGEIAVRGWCERSFYVVDPFGNELCFVNEDALFNGT